MKLAIISDSHNQHRNIEIPECDILIHCGDFSYTGDFQSIWEINKWFGKLKKEGKIGQIVCVAGNHDWGFERNPSLFRSIMTNCIYLQDEPLELIGYKWYGSPRTPEFNNWAFNEQRGEQIAKWWARIPDDTQILITHGPQMGTLDLVDRGTRFEQHVGCEELKKRIDQLKDLRLHCFGHLHDNNGIYIDPIGKIFVNAAICSEGYQPIQPVQVVEL